MVVNCPEAKADLRGHVTPEYSGNLITNIHPHTPHQFPRCQRGRDFHETQHILFSFPAKTSRDFHAGKDGEQTPAVPPARKGLSWEMTSGFMTP